MKKINLLVLLLFCLVITGCNSNKSKDVGTLDSFEATCTNNGLSVSDNMQEYKDVNYVSEAKVAVLDDIRIQMVIYDNNENAENVFNEHISAFMTMRGSGSVINKDKGNNYYHFDMISNGYYMVTSRIDNTLIFTKTPVKNKEIVDSIFNELDY
jgi:hypothetical protein